MKCPVLTPRSLAIAAALLLAAARSAVAQSLCAGTPPPLVMDLDVHQTPPLPEPAPRVPFRDPTFGTCVVRVTDRVGDPDPSDPSDGMKQEYSRVQAFNADGSAILVRSTEAFWYVYDAATLLPVHFVDIQADIEPRWDASDPDLFHYTLDTTFWSYRVSTGQRTPIRDFAADFPGWGIVIVSTKAEGSPTIDGSRIALAAQDGGGIPLAFLVYDIAGNALLDVRDVRALPAAADVNNISISPRGTYVVVQYDNGCPALGTDADPCGTMVYGADLMDGRGVILTSPHMDMALDAAGREVIVYQDNRDFISMVDMATCAVTDLFPIDFGANPTLGLHFSGRADLVPGWALVTTHDSQTTDTTWMDDQAFAVELVAGGRVVRIAHTHSVSDVSQSDYWSEPQGTTNRDMTRILFSSNWGRVQTAQVDMFMVELPAGWAGGGSAIVSGPGSGLPNPNLAATWSAAGTPVASWNAYGAGRWGTRVAGGEIDVDGEAEAVTGPGPGDVYGPQVRAFDPDGTPDAKVNFFAYGTLKYGVNVATGALDADPPEELLTGAGPGAVFGPHVRAFDDDGGPVAPIAKVNFFAYATLKYGVNVDAGSVDADAFAEILTGPGPSSAFASQLRGFDYDGAAVSAIPGLNAELFAGLRHGLVAGSGDLEGDGFEEVVAAKGPGPGYDAQVRGYDVDGSGSLTPMAGVDVIPFPGLTRGARADAGAVDADAEAEMLLASGPEPAASTRIRGYELVSGVAMPMAGTDFVAHAPLGYGADVAPLPAP